MNKKQIREQRPPEIPVNLDLWLRDGIVRTGNDSDNPKAMLVDWPLLSVGRADSERRLGFAMRRTFTAPWILFTLDRAQVKNLRDHLTYQLRRLKITEMV